MANVTEEESTDMLSTADKDRAKKVIAFSIFQSVLQHVLAIQSEISLFTIALKGDQAKVSRALSLSTAITGVLGLVLNQFGGRLSDAFGRKIFFLTGPAVNFIASLTLLLYPRNATVLMMVRILKGMFITFSGSVMGAASLQDVCSAEEQKALGPKIQLSVGAAVIIGPFLESLILKLGNGDARGPYKAMMLFSLLQIFNGSVLLPETLVKSKRSTIESWTATLAASNPFSFVKAYACKNAAFKRLLTISTFQSCVDGKCTSDLSQLWFRNHCGWTLDQSRNFVACWGLSVVFGAAVVHPKLLKALHGYDYSTVGNVCVGLGLAIHGLSTKGSFMWAGLPLLIPGVNGGSAHAVKAACSEIAKQEGFGNGEYSAWVNNLRTLAQAANVVLLGMWYAYCEEHGLYSGSTWWVVSFVGAWLPQLLLLAGRRDDFDIVEKAQDKAS